MTGETRRQIEHMLPLGFAFLLRYLSLLQAVLCCVAALVYGVFVSQRINRGGVRPDEAGRGWSPAKAYYALTVLLLIVVFRERMHIAAGAWAVLSLGDSLSNIAGRAWGRRRLPWSDNRTWTGSVVFVLSSWAGSLALVWWTAAGTGAALPGPWVVTASCGLASVAGALAESLPLPVNDNITSPLAAAAVMAVFL